MNPQEHDLVVPLLPMRPPAVLFPTQLPLRIGRPRARQAVVAAADGHRMLIAGLQRRPEQEASVCDYHPIAICLDLLKVMPMKGGIGIQTRGRARVRIEAVERDPVGDHLVAGVRVLDWGEAPGTTAQIDCLLAGARQLAPDPRLHRMLDGLRDAPGALADTVAAFVLGKHMSRAYQLELLAVPAERRVEATRLAVQSLL